jgi:hypothetical protein
VSPSRAAGLNSIEVACGGISMCEYPALALVNKKGHYASLFVMFAKKKKKK